MAYDRYTIELRKGTEHVRSNTATNVENAIDIIEAFRSRTEYAEKVVWEAREVDRTGLLEGRAPSGLSWQIQVVPDLSVQLGG